MDISGLGLHEQKESHYRGRGLEGPREASLVWQGGLQCLVFHNDITLLGLLLLQQLQILFLLL